MGSQVGLRPEIGVETPNGDITNYPGNVTLDGSLFSQTEGPIKPEDAVSSPIEFKHLHRDTTNQVTETSCSPDHQEKIEVALQGLPRYIRENIKEIDVVNEDFWKNDPAELSKDAKADITLRPGESVLRLREDALSSTNQEGLTKSLAHEGAHLMFKLLEDGHPETFEQVFGKWEAFFDENDLQDQKFPKDILDGKTRHSQHENNTKGLKWWAINEMACDVLAVQHLVTNGSSPKEAFSRTILQDLDESQMEQALELASETLDTANSLLGEGPIAVNHLMRDNSGNLWGRIRINRTNAEESRSDTESLHLAEKCHVSDLIYSSQPGAPETAGTNNSVTGRLLQVPLEAATQAGIDPEELSEALGFDPSEGRFTRTDNDGEEYLIVALAEADKDAIASSETLTNGRLPHPHSYDVYNLLTAIEEHNEERIQDCLATISDSISQERYESHADQSPLTKEDESKLAEAVESLRHDIQEEIARDHGPEESESPEPEEEEHEAVDLGEISQAQEAAAEEQEQFNVPEGFEFETEELEGGIVVEGTSVGKVDREKPNRQNQDTFRLPKDSEVINLDGQEYYVASLLDGVGSYEGSGQVARAISRLLPQYLKRYPNLEGSLALKRALVDINTLEREVRNGSGTAVGAFVLIPKNPDETGNRKAVWAQVGDAEIRKNGMVINDPDLHRGGAANVVKSTIGGGYQLSLIDILTGSITLGPQDTLSLNSDGSNNAYTGRYSGVWNPIWLEKPGATLATIKAMQDNFPSADDKTMVTVNSSRN